MEMREGSCHFCVSITLQSWGHAVTWNQQPDRGDNVLHQMSW